MSFHKKAAVCFLLLFALAVREAQAQWLRIYHLGIGQGDCTLIIGNDKKVSDNTDLTFSVMIDSGNTMSENKLAHIWGFVKDTIDKYCSGRLDFVVTSHLHADHVGNFPKLIEWMHNNKKVEPVVHFVDRMAFDDVYGEPEDECWDAPRSRIVKDYLNAIVKYFPARRLRVSSGSYLFPEELKNIRIQCLSANGVANGESFVTGSKPKNENDLSFSFMVTFNGFHYFTGGDIGGGSPYLDGETPIADYVVDNYPDPFHACFLKVSHHGSYHSTNERFLYIFEPYAAVVPSALKSFRGTQLPTYGTLEALTDSGALLYYTYTVSNDKYYTGTPVDYRDVDIYIPAPPGYEHDIPIIISQQLRNKETMELKGVPILSTITCDKQHEEPTMEEEAARRLAREAAPKVVPVYKTIIAFPKTPAHKAQQPSTQHKKATTKGLKK